MLTNLAKLLIALVAVTGVVIDLLYWDPGTRGRLNLFSYYTEQSNLLVAVVFGLVVWNSLRGKVIGKVLSTVERALRLWILLTGLAFHFLLSGTYHPQGMTAISNLLLHYVVPAGVFLTWLLTEPKGAYRFGEIGWWVSFPLAYCVFSLVRGQLDGFYPYWFVNPAPAPVGVGSLGAVGLWASALSVGLILIGVIVWGLDKLLARAFRDKDAA